MKHLRLLHFCAACLTGIQVSEELIRVAAGKFIVKVQLYL